MFLSSSKWHTSANSARIKNSRDLILGAVVYITIIYRIPDSWIHLLNGYDFEFWSHDWWKTGFSDSNWAGRYKLSGFDCFSTGKLWKAAYAVLREKKQAGNKYFQLHVFLTFRIGKLAILRSWVSVVSWIWTLRKISRFCCRLIKCQTQTSSRRIFVFFLLNEKTHYIRRVVCAMIIFSRSR